MIFLRIALWTFYFIRSKISTFKKQNLPLYSCKILEVLLFFSTNDLKLFTAHLVVAQPYYESRDIQTVLVFSDYLIFMFIVYCIQIYIQKIQENNVGGIRIDKSFETFFVNIENLTCLVVDCFKYFKENFKFFMNLIKKVKFY